mgnify:FL=1
MHFDVWRSLAKRYGTSGGCRLSCDAKLSSLASSLAAHFRISLRSHKMALDSSPDKIRFVAKPGSNPSREVDVPIFPPPPLISPVPPPSPPQPSMPRLRSYFPSDRLDRLRSHPSLAWFSSALLVDWLVAIALGAASTWVERQYPFKRDVTHYLSDPSVSWPHAAHERVPAGPSSLLDLLTFYLPLLVLVLVSALRLSLHEMHHAVLALFSSRAIMRIVVECVKNRVGKLRPDFLDRCAWDAMEGVCTGAAALVKDGRRSFPSGTSCRADVGREGANALRAGHSATSLQGLGLLALFLAGRNGTLRARAVSTCSDSFAGAFAFDASFPRSTLLQSRLLRFSIAVSPLFLAAWICITSVLSSASSTASDRCIQPHRGQLPPRRRVGPPSSSLAPANLRKVSSQAQRLAFSPPSSSTLSTFPIRSIAVSSGSWIGQKWFMARRRRRGLSWWGRRRDWCGERRWRRFEHVN